MLVVSLFFSAIVYNLFLLPVNLVTGGAGGIATITNYVYGIDPALMILIVSITCALLSELTLKKIKVIFCDAKRNPQSELVSYYGSHDCSQKLKNQIAWNEISKQQVWTVIVAQKINNSVVITYCNSA